MYSRTLVKVGSHTYHHKPHYPMLTRRARNSATDLALAILRQPSMSRSLPQVSKQAVNAALLSGGAALARKAVKVAKASGPSLRGAKASLSKADGAVTSAPVARGIVTRSSGPATSSSKGGGFCVRHRELINSAVSSNTTFAISNSYVLQPGNSTTFPWLSTIAANYEQYRFKTLRFVYIPFCPTSQAGAIMLMTDYDASDLPPTTETQFMDHPGATTAACWESITFRCEPSMLHALGPRKFVRTCAVAGDIKTFDCGTFFVATDNVTTTPNIGKIYVEYEIEFFVPQLTPSPATYPLNTSLVYSNTNHGLTTNVAAKVLFDVAAVPVQDPLNWTGAYSAGIFTPPAGCYRYELTVTCSDSANEAFYIDIRAFKNGVQYPNSSYYSITSSGGEVSNYLSTALVGILPMNGTDTVYFRILLLGAAGTLNQQSAQLVISLA